MSRRGDATIARWYREETKAEAGGYSVDDVAWYTPAALRDVLPLALDADFDGLVGEPGDGVRVRGTPGEGGTMLAMIVDCRRALAACPAAAHDLRWSAEGSDVHRAALTVLADWLGGPYPGPEWRRAMSNAAAIGLIRT